MIPAMQIFPRFLAAACIVMAFAVPARAHPHVWVTMKSELVYAADGTTTGVRHAWTFDDMFSTYALQGLETKEKESAFGMVDRRAELSASSWCARLVLGPGAVLGFDMHRDCIAI